MGVVGPFRISQEPCWITHHDTSKVQVSLIIKHTTMLLRLMCIILVCVYPESALGSDS